MIKSLIVLWAIQASMVFHFADADAQQPSLAMPRFALGDSVEVQGVELFDRIIYFPVSINGSGPLSPCKTSSVTRSSQA